MKNKFNRRNFIFKGAQACIGTCALMAFNSGLSMGNSYKFFSTDDPIDPKKLNYCGYKCPTDCKFLNGSVNNNIELKKEAYELWKIKERFGVEFDPEKIFCFGCKTSDKPEGIVLKNCTVRSCSIEKGYDCCIECEELSACQKELWERFPDFKKYVIEMQGKYLAGQKSS